MRTLPCPMTPLRTLACLTLGFALSLLAGCAADRNPAAPAAPGASPTVDPAADASGVNRGRVGTDLRPIVSRPVTGSARYPGLTIRIRGKFDSKLDPEDTNLPVSSYPYPDLFGGRFEGVVTLPVGAEPLPPEGGVRDGADSYKYGRVSVDIVSATGQVIHRIAGGSEHLRKYDSHRQLRLNLGSPAGLPGVADDLVIDLTGIFLPRDGAPPTADELNQAALRGGALTVPGPHPGTQWNLEVALIEIRAVAGVDN